MTARRLGIAVMALGIGALVLGVTAPSAAAAPPEQVGWWFQLQGGPLPVAVAVPTVPDGGLYVQQGAAGPIAYGALRYRVPAGSSSILTLTAAPGSVALAASMQACKTSSAWTAPSPAPGAWDERPAFGIPCSPGIASSDGAAVAFNLSASFVADGVLDVAIVPLSAATPFAVAFQPPGDDALASSGGRPSISPPLPTTSTTVARPPASSGSAGGSSALPPVASPAGSTGVARPAPGAAAAPTSAPAARDDAGRSPLANSVVAAVGFGDPDRGARAAALGGASLIVVGWWLLTSQPMRMPRLLGAMAAPPSDGQADSALRVGGVGRFARAREGAASRLR
jgi:hypothetical protein